MLQYIIAGAAFLGILVVFLVISRTLGNIVNQLAKLEYLLAKDLERTSATRDADRRRREEDLEEEEARQALVAQEDASAAQKPPDPVAPGTKKSPGKGKPV